MPLAKQRHELILNALARYGSLRTSELAARLDASEMTIRRDLAELEAQKRLERVHGGAALLLDPKDTYTARHVASSDEKHLIAEQAVAALAQKKEEGTFPRTLYLDAGTTTMAFAEAFTQITNLPPCTVFTHAINIAAYLASQGFHRLHVIGGEVYQNTFGTFGVSPLKQISQLHFDLFVMGASGFNEMAFMNTNYVEIGTKQAVIEQSGEVWMMVDSGKWQSNFAVICGYDAIDRLFIGPKEHPQKKQLSKMYPKLDIVHCQQITQK